MTGDFRIKNIPIVFKAIMKLRNWNDYFLDLFNITRKNAIIYQFRNGLKFYSRAKTTDRGIITTVALLDEYKLSKQDLDENSIVIDIGAQNGYFAIYASQYAGKIYSFEPVPANFENIIKNIKLNNLKKKILPFNLAVSPKKEKVKIKNLQLAVLECLKQKNHLLQNNWLLHMHLPLYLCTAYYIYPIQKQ